MPNISRPRSLLKQHSLGVLRKRGVPVRTVLDVSVLDGTPELIEAYPNLLHILFEPVVEFRDRIEMNNTGIPHKFVLSAVSDRSGTTALGPRAWLAGMLAARREYPRQ